MSEHASLHAPRKWRDCLLHRGRGDDQQPSPRSAQSGFEAVVQNDSALPNICSSAITATRSPPRRWTTTTRRSETLTFSRRTASRITVYTDAARLARVVARQKRTFRRRLRSTTLFRRFTTRPFSFWQVEHPLRLPTRTARSRSS